MEPLTAAEEAANTIMGATEMLHRLVSYAKGHQYNGILEKCLDSA